MGRKTLQMVTEKDSCVESIASACLQPQGSSAGQSTPLDTQLDNRAMGMQHRNALCISGVAISFKSAYSCSTSGSCGQSPLSRANWWVSEGANL